ncbi:hypothetical protein Adu01nite_92300 [Paractinoplanes durhamensis]|uniref:Uncharacterized protein n=1 Tax=Paractinoplanes durhamensis TaxID=113563 RepID=A0ABQ3ZDI2_9ACTN|nr:hypothetical protein Adu01nite_92300 [Actinoplanes durhamensis]
MVGAQFVRQIRRPALKNRLDESHRARVRIGLEIHRMTSLFEARPRLEIACVADRWIAPGADRSGQS